MGLILDTNIAVKQERAGASAKDLLRGIEMIFGDATLGMSVVSVAELTHGVYRARTSLIAQRRQTFLDEMCLLVAIHSMSFSIAKLVGRIEGEQAAKGIAIEFEDLVIGATALELGFSVLTLNTKHFELIPGLPIATL